MLAVNQENEKLMEEYEKLASEVSLGPERMCPLPHLGCPSLALQLLLTLAIPGQSPSPQSSLALPQAPSAMFTHLLPLSAYPSSW